MTRYCDLLVGRTENGFVIRVQGSGTSSHSPGLADFVMDCFERDPAELVTVDLLGCDYLDSTFLGCLAQLQRAGTATRFQVVADETARKKLLTATQLDAFLTLVPAAPTSAGTFLKIEAAPQSERELGQHVMEAHEALAELPSDLAPRFQQIAAQLKRDLKDRDRNDPSLTDTVVLRTRAHK